MERERRKSEKELFEKEKRSRLRRGRAARTRERASCSESRHFFSSLPSSLQKPAQGIHPPRWSLSLSPLGIAAVAVRGRG